MSNYEVHAPRMTLDTVGSDDLRTGVEFRWSFNRTIFTLWPLGLSGFFCCFSLFLFHVWCFSGGKCLLHLIHSPADVSHYQNKEGPHTGLGHCSRVNRSKPRNVILVNDRNKHS